MTVLPTESLAIAIIGYADGPLPSDKVITRPSFTPNNLAYDNALARAFLTAAVRADSDALLASSTNGETPVTCKLSPPAATTASTTTLAFAAFLIVTTKDCDARYPISFDPPYGV